jgi:hypothetical protein
MIKAMAHTAEGDIIVLGISAENVRRLKQNEIIYFNPAQLHIEPGTPLVGISLFYANTDQDLFAAMKELLGGKTDVIVSPRGDQKPQ